jgi:hypothetical protein
MGIEDFIDDDEFEFQNDESSGSEHQLIGEELDQVFESGFVESRIREELDEQFESQGISVSNDATLPEAPYSWDATDALEDTWPVVVAEYIISDESRCDKRYWKATARATEHLDCSPQTVHKALTCRTFYESYLFEHEEWKNFDVSAPSAELIRDILSEIERRLRVREPDIIEQIMEAHDTDICLEQN